MAARKSTSARLMAVRAQLSDLAAVERQLKAQQAREERRRDAHRKAILGGWVMARDPELAARIIGSLTRPQDRAAFDLPPLHHDPLGGTDGAEVAS